jgi:hypothetical protein
MTRRSLNTQLFVSALGFAPLHSIVKMQKDWEQSQQGGRAEMSSSVLSTW